MTIIDLVTFGPILQQLNTLEADLQEQQTETQTLLDQVELVLHRQRETAERLAELRASLRNAADEHGRARLAAGTLHDRR